MQKSAGHSNEARDVAGFKTFPNVTLRTLRFTGTASPASSYLPNMHSKSASCRKTVFRTSPSSSVMSSLANES